MRKLVGGVVPATICIVGLLQFGCSEGQSQADTRLPYEIVEVAPGVFAAIANPGGSAGANAGIINTGKHAIVFDAGLTPRAGRQLRSVGEELTAQRIPFVIFSHFRDDHIGGGQAFDQPTYLSTTPTQEAVMAAGERRSEEELADAEAALATATQRLAVETNERARRDLELMVDRYRGIVETGNKLRRMVPTVVWDRSLRLSGSDRSIRFMPVVKGHAEGEAILWLEEDSVLFAGDVVTTDRHPDMRYGDPDGWMGLLNSLLTLDFKLLVPGHGPLGDRESVATMKEYLRSVGRAAEEVMAGADVDSMTVDSAFADWMLSSRFADNVRFVTSYRQEKQSSE